MAKTQLLKLTMENGTGVIISTDMSMFDIGNELRSKAKMSFTNEDGKEITLKSDDVHSLEHYIVPR